MMAEADSESWRGKCMLQRVRKVLVKALNVSTRKRLGNFLDPDLSLLSQSSGIQQDWQGLGELMGLGYSEIQNMMHKQEKTCLLIQQWSLRSNSTIGQLIDFLEQMERYDLLEDNIFQTRILKDVDAYNLRETEDRMNSGLMSPVQVDHVDSYSDVIPGDDLAEFGAYDEFKNITIGEVTTGQPEFFDAFVCYTFGDITFVKQMLSQLEGTHGLKLCVPDRDLTPGSAKHTAMSFLVKKRCNKMIIILSEKYLHSAECDFMTKFGHALAPGARSKKLIPVLVHRNCPIPDILRYITLVDYTKCELVEWFWGRLAKALQETSVALLFSPTAVQAANEQAHARIHGMEQDESHSEEIGISGEYSSDGAVSMAIEPQVSEQLSQLPRDRINSDLRRQMQAQNVLLSASPPVNRSYGGGSGSPVYAGGNNTSRSISGYTSRSVMGQQGAVGSPNSPPRVCQQALGYMPVQGQPNFRNPAPQRNHLQQVTGSSRDSAISGLNVTMSTDTLASSNSGSGRKPKPPSGENFKFF